MGTPGLHPMRKFAWPVACMLTGIVLGLPVPSISATMGHASWYGPGFGGRRTASGERFNPHALTGAHRTLPLGTNVRVTNLRNGRSVTVRINDRGPFVRGRTIDLSLAAARQIGLTGIGRVSIERVS